MECGTGKRWPPIAARSGAAFEADSKCSRLWQGSKGRPLRVNHPFTRPRHRYWLHFEQKCRFNFQTAKSQGVLRRHCEPTGRANARPMTGSAKQSIARAVIASAAKQSISPRKERMDCFAALAMTWNCRRDFATSRHEAPEALMSPRTRAGSAATCQPCHLAPQRKALPCSHLVGADRKQWRDGKVELHLRCC